MTASVLEWWYLRWYSRWEDIADDDDNEASDSYGNGSNDDDNGAMIFINDSSGNDDNDYDNIDDSKDDNDDDGNIDYSDDDDDDDNNDQKMNPLITVHISWWDFDLVLWWRIELTDDSWIPLPFITHFAIGIIFEAESLNNCAWNL